MTGAKTDIPVTHRDLLNARGLSFISTIRPDGLISSHRFSLLWDGALFRFSSGKSRQKVRNLRADDRITACIPDPGNPLRYLEIRGHADIEDDPDRLFIDSIAKEFMGVDKYPYDPPGFERVTITIRIAQVSGSAVVGGARKESQ
jgi:PPOX class probable F420-dependent enzyme